jgi:hypothetical protein
MVLAFAGLIVLAACGGSATPTTGTPAGTYNVLVKGTAGTVTQSVTVPVTVN